MTRRLNRRGIYPPGPPAVFRKGAPGSPAESEGAYSQVTTGIPVVAKERQGARKNRGPSHDLSHAVPWPRADEPGSRRPLRLGEQLVLLAVAAALAGLVAGVYAWTVSDGTGYVAEAARGTVAVMVWLAVPAFAFLLLAWMRRPRRAVSAR